MKTIFKYPIAFHGHTAVRGPAPLNPLSVGLQDDQVVVWCAVDTEAEHMMQLDMYGVFTGQPAPVEHPRVNHHVGTLQYGGFVSHFFADRPYFPEERT